MVRGTGYRGGVKGSRGFDPGFNRRIGRGGFDGKRDYYRSLGLGRRGDRRFYDSGYWPYYNVGRLDPYYYQGAGSPYYYQGVGSPYYPYYNPYYGVKLVDPYSPGKVDPVYRPGRLYPYYPGYADPYYPYYNQYLYD